MNAAQLKASILQQAIEGKLVPNIRVDGSVEQIGSSTSECPFAIPESWQWLSFQDILIFENGDRGKNYPAKSKLSKDASSGHPFVSASNISDGRIATQDLLFLSEEQYEKLKSGHIKANDCLMCIRGSLGKFGFAERDGGAIASSLVILRIKYQSLLDKNFLSIVLSSPLFSDSIIARKNGTAQPNLGADVLKKFPFPLPLLAEQKRIVARIEELMPLVEEYGKAYDKLQELNDELPSKLKASILQEAIQGKLVPQLPEDGVVEQICDAPAEVPFDIPHTWTSCILFDVAELITDGSHNPPPNTGSGIPVLSAKDLSNGILTADKASRWTDEEHWTSEFKRCPVQMDDIVLCIVGSIGKVGRVKVETKAMLQRSLALIRVNESIITKDFFELFLNSLFCQKWLVKGSAGTAQKGIYLKSLRNLPVVIPPLAEQKRIVAKVNALFEQIDLMIK